MLKVLLTKDCVSTKIIKEVLISNMSTRSDFFSLAKNLALKRFNSASLYHGRAGDGTNWQVQGNFENLNNATGNNNFSNVSGLYLSSKEVAEMFAEARAKQKRAQKEVYKIVCKSDEKYVININTFDHDIYKFYRTEMPKLIRALLDKHDTYYSPFSILDIQEARAIVQFFDNNKKEYYSSKEMFELKKELCNNPQFKKFCINNSKKMEDLIVKMCTIKNTRFLLQHKFPELICSYLNGSKMVYLNNKNDVLTESLFFDAEYIKNFLSYNNIIGVQVLVDSATINKRILTTQIFDLDEIATEEQLENLKKQNKSRYLSFEKTLSGYIDDNRVYACLKNSINKANGEALINFMSEDYSCKKLFNLPCYVWEDWNVAQHTASVIDCFEKYYSKKFPKSMKCVLKTAMVIHDIGKGIAKAPSSEYRGNQYSANKEYAKFAYDKLGLPNELRVIVDYLITDSQKFTTALFIGNPDKMDGEVKKQKEILFNQFYDSTKQFLWKLLEREPLNNEVLSLIEMATILQTCDSMSYTKYGTVKDENGFYVAGGNERFLSSFKIGRDGKPCLKGTEILDSKLTTYRKL